MTPRRLLVVLAALVAPVLAGAAPVSAAPAAPSAAAAAAAGATLRYLGEDADVVGYGASNEPDGIPDGHFRVTVTTDGTDLQFDTITLVGTDATGANPRGTVWTTRPGDQSILGVAQSGTRLNPGPGWNNMGGVVKGSATYDLYASDVGFFNPGEQYRVVFESYAILKAQATVAVPPGLTPFARIVYRGVTADLVGAGSPAPDRQRDAQFTLILKGLPRQLNLLWFTLTNVTGPGGPRWSTHPDGPWVLGVVRGGKRLNAKTVELVSTPFKGPATYELYGNDPAKLQKGQWYRIEITFYDPKANHGRYAYAAFRL